MVTATASDMSVTAGLDGWGPLVKTQIARGSPIVPEEVCAMV